MHQRKVYLKHLDSSSVDIHSKFSHPDVFVLEVFCAKIVNCLWVLVTCLWVLVNCGRVPTLLEETVRYFECCIFDLFCVWAYIAWG